MNKPKNILFLSGLDFKEKSIQVIRKTPEAYRDAGWNVTYIVARDNCKTGNYFYEKEINLEGINIHRFEWSFAKWRTTNNRYLSLILSKIASFIVIFRLFITALMILKQKPMDVVYGYEIQGVLALKLLNLFSRRRYLRVKRFQGSFLYEMLSKKEKMRLLFNIDAYYALKVKADLTIMTDDGTQGDKAHALICSKTKEKFKFYVNGVDNFQYSEENVLNIKKQLELDDKKVFVSISRLVGWKRVDRNINIIEQLVKLGYQNIRYIIVGDGDLHQSLVQLVKEKSLENYITFVGSKKQSEVNDYLACADFFFSMYESSNVGNPLLEAIRAHKVIITLNNGDTGNWIKHQCNGLIYDEYESSKIIAKDIYGLLQGKDSYQTLLAGIKQTEKEKLWTWKERMNAEIEAVNESLEYHK